MCYYSNNWDSFKVFHFKQWFQDFPMFNKTTGAASVNLQNYSKKLQAVPFAFYCIWQRLVSGLKQLWNMIHQGSANKYKQTPPSNECASVQMLRSITAHNQGQENSKQN